MELPLRRIEGVNMNYRESDVDSDLQLIFTPGGYNPELWRHQVKYFSKNYRTIVFGNTPNEKGYRGEKKALDAILEQESVENAVLVSNILGNPLVQSFEEREEVKTTVLSGPLVKNFRFTDMLYSILWKTVRREPKIMKKIFFSHETDYRVIKRFSEEIEPPGHQIHEEYANRDVRTPVKLSLVIHSRDDRFSELEKARSLKSRLSVIERAGTFSFYEKPQEYNKALNDFLEIVKQEVREQEIIKSSERNRSLEEFEKLRVER